MAVDIVIVGASGHGREVLEILETSVLGGGPDRLVGFVDDDVTKRGKSIDGLPILGGFEWLANQPSSDVLAICAVGDPRILIRLAKRASSIGVRFASAISDLAQVSRRSTIGIGALIFPHVVVNVDACIGDHVTLNVGVTVSHDAKVGRFSNINPGAHLAGNVIVGEGCYVGMGANIIQNVSVGPWSIIGAGAVVIRDIPAAATAVGNPARVIKQNLKAG